MDVLGNVVRYRLSRLDHQPLDNLGLRPIQKHFKSSNRHRSDFWNFEHEYIWIKVVAVVPTAPGKKPNVQPMSATHYDPPPAGGFRTPKYISIQCKENRHTQPHRCAH